MGEKILILDFGAQYTQLIARRIREGGVYSEIFPCGTDAGVIEEMHPMGIILSGGPSSVYEGEAPSWDERLLDLRRRDGYRLPVLGICYGLQVMAHIHGGDVEAAGNREFGRAQLEVLDDEDLLAGVPSGTQVWMSHGDTLTTLPKDYIRLARTTNAPEAAVRSLTRPHYGVQFHPEVVHSDHGGQILNNFAKKICGCSGNWTATSFVERKVREVREVVGKDTVLLGLSGGVDSSVAAKLLHDAIGDQLICVFVNNGLLREGEWEEVQTTFGDYFDIPLHAIDASDRFLRRLENVTDPETKRTIIGNTFVEVFEEETRLISRKVGQSPRFLAQGTLYPDVIESISFKGPSATIKTHHNVGGLPDEHRFELLEPFRELFKDEVRAIGRILGVPESIISRHPFPGPGLAVRVIGPVDRENLDILRGADQIFIDELRSSGLYGETWQAFAVLVLVQTVGVMGDQRTYEYVCALRAVTSVDGMTADWARLPHEFLAHVSNRIVNEIRGINRVAYDISSKPPATIEWE